MHTLSVASRSKNLPRLTLLAVFLAVTASGRAAASEGMKVPADQNLWTISAGSLLLATPLPTYSLSLSPGSGKSAGLAKVSGDYYLRAWGAHGDYGGFRATTGLWLGQRVAGLATPLSADGSIPLARWAMPSGYGDANADGSTTAAYLGLGYSAGWPKSGLSFSADLGLLAQRPGQAVRLGRVFTGTDNLDDMLHDMHMAPMLQLNASYSF